MTWLPLSQVVRAASRGCLGGSCAREELLKPEDDFRFPPSLPLGACGETAGCGGPEAQDREWLEWRVWLESRTLQWGRCGYTCRVRVLGFLCQSTLRSVGTVWVSTHSPSGVAVCPGFCVIIKSRPRARRGRLIAAVLGLGWPSESQGRADGPVGATCRPGVVVSACRSEPVVDSPTPGRDRTSLSRKVPTQAPAGGLLRRY